jgi:hypothetical protein
MSVELLAVTDVTEKFSVLSKTDHLARSLVTEFRLQEVDNGRLEALWDVLIAI